MRPDVIIEARAYVRDTFDDVEFGVDLDSGTITEVRKNLPGTPRKRFTGQVLFPSGVDLHVHLRDPGSPRKEDFRSGTTGAALGGVGTVLDMPNTDPVVDRLSRLEEKADLVAGKACVDWGLWCTLTPASKKPLDLLRASVGAKMYLAPTSGIPDPGTMADLESRIEAATRLRRLVALHAERVRPSASTTLADHDASRSPEGEVATIESVAHVAPKDALVHIAHASTLEAARAARTAGFSFGVTPHHLLLSYDEGDLGTWGKVNPPLRGHRRRAELWDAFAAGQIPLIESDHAPHTKDEKAHPFPEAPAGVPGVETTYPLLLHEARRKNVPLELVVRAMAEAPAARLGLKKGRIAAGFDADFFTLDPHRTTKIRAAELASRCGWTPFEGWDSFRVEAHFLHGDLVVEDHRFVGRAGRGRPLQPELLSPAPLP